MTTTPIQNSKETQEPMHVSVHAQPRKPVVPSLTFVPLEEISGYVNLFIIGIQGAGKTELATSAAEDHRVEGILYLDVERGIKSGADHIRAHREKFHIMYLKNPNEGGNVVTEMSEFIRYARIATNRTMAEENGIPYVNMIVIDSISALAGRVMDKINGVSKTLAEGSLPKSANWDAYNGQKAILENWVTAIREMDCHFIVTCLEHMGENQVTKVQEPQPHMTRSLGEKLPSLFDAVFWLSHNRKADPNPDGTIPRTLICRANKTYDAKTRAPRSLKLPVSLEDPTMTTIFKYFLFTD